MDIFESVLGTSVPTGVKLVIVTLILVAVLLLIFWIIRKITGSSILKAPRGRQPRLAVTDAASMDDKRRLVLVRRDNVEHLVMIGGATDVLIESNIVRNQPVKAPPAVATAKIQPAVATVPPAPVHALLPADENADRTIAKPVVQTAAAIATGAVAANFRTKDNIKNAPDAAKIPAPKPDLTLDANAEKQAAEKIEPVPAQIPNPPHKPKDITAEIAGFAPDEKPDLPVPEPPKIKEDEITSPEPELSQSAIANLEDALGNELTADDGGSMKVDKASEEKPDNEISGSEKPGTSKKQEDEMQKLLDELAGEKA